MACLLSLASCHLVKVIKPWTLENKHLKIHALLFIQCSGVKVPCNCLHNISLCFLSSNIALHKFGLLQILDDGVDSIDQFSTFLSKEKSDELSFAISTCFHLFPSSTKGCAKSNLKLERSAPLPLVNID